jgi:HlyD family secretion protein
MKIWLEIWRVLDGAQRRRLIALLGVAGVMAFATTGGVAAVIPFFAVLADPQSIHRSQLLSYLFTLGEFSDEQHFAIAVGIGFLTVLVASNAVNFMGAVAITRFASSVGKSMHVALLSDYLHRNYQFHATTDRATLSTNILHEVDRLAQGVLHGGLLLVTSACTTLLIVASMLVFSPAIAAFTIASVGGSYAIFYATARVRLRQNGKKKSKLLADRSRIVNETLANTKEIATHQAQAFFVARFERACNQLNKVDVSSWAIANSARHVLECLTVGAIVAIAMYLSANGPGASPWLPQLTFVGFGAYRLLPAMQQMFTALARVRIDHAAFENLAADLLHARESPRPPRDTIIDRAWRGRPVSEVALNEVWFSYSTEAPPVLRDVRLRIRAGSMVGVVGLNGAGKTTLIDVMLGLLSPQRGTVEIDGVVLDATNIGAWRAAAAYVPQHVTLMDLSIAENIAFGIDGTHFDLRRVREVARLAQIEDLISQMPKGYDTRVGDDGVRLSGGQRQRVAIARALYRCSSFLVLDEATSALDGQMETDLIGILEALRGRCTIVLIAHRPAAVRCCDLVFEIEDGRIVAGGHYGDLLAKSGQLRRMFEPGA